MTRFRMLATAVLLVAVSPLVGRALAEADDPAAWVPDDALFYIGVTDIDATVAGVKETSAYRLMNDAQAREIMPEVDVFGQFTEKLKTRVAEALDIGAGQLENPFAGGVALYVTLPTGGNLDDDGEVVFVAGVGNAELMKRYYDQALKRLSEAADERDTKSYKSQRVDILRGAAPTDDTDDETLTEDDGFDWEGFDPSDPTAFGKQLDKALDEMFALEEMPPEFAMCLTSDRLILSSSANEIKAVLRREKLKGSLLANMDYRRMKRLLPEAGTLRLFINLPRIIKLASADGGDEADKWQAALGLDAFGSIIGHARIGGDVLEYEMEIIALLRGERSGLAKIFSMDNAAIAPPKFIPEHTALYGSLNINLLDMLDEIERIIRQTDPDEADEMRASLAAIPIGPEETIDLRKDVFAHLRPPLTISLGFTKPYGASSLQLLLTLGHRQREALLKLLTLAQLPPREFRGAELYEPMPGIAVALSDDQLLAGTTPSVEAAIQAAGEGLGADDQFKAILKEIPREASGVVYADSRKITEALLAFVEKPELLQGPEAAMNMGAFITTMMVNQYGQSMDSENVGELRKLLKYQTVGLGTLRTSPDGLHMIAVQLKPAE